MGRNVAEVTNPNTNVARVEVAREADKMNATHRATLAAAGATTAMRGNFK